MDLHHGPMEREISRDESVQLLTVAGARRDVAGVRTVTPEWPDAVALPGGYMQLDAVLRDDELAAGIALEVPRWIWPKGVVDHRVRVWCGCA